MKSRYNEILPNLYVFEPIWVKFREYGIYKSLFFNYEFHENRHSRSNINISCLHMILLDIDEFHENPRGEGYKFL